MGGRCDEPGSIPRRFAVPHETTTLKVKVNKLTTCAGYVVKVRTNSAT